MQPAPLQLSHTKQIKPNTQIKSLLKDGWVALRQTNIKHNPSMFGFLSVTLAHTAASILV